MRALSILLVLFSSTAFSNDTATTLLKPFKKELKQALMAGLQQGPESAVQVCQQQAPALAQRFSVNGVEMGRTSDKLRNPANTAPEWVVPILKQFQSGDLTPVTVALDANTEGYAEPIMVGPPCLTCHGNQITPPVQQALNEAYPDDHAIGYELGQWRGLFWVSYPNQ
ncbi:DUF3365 domain-containing protein [Halomonas denitrificans]|nr:DUF3365 domain-containing protein [Halomonas denitrificans]